MYNVRQDCDVPWDSSPLGTSIQKLRVKSSPNPKHKLLTTFCASGDRTPQVAVLPQIASHSHRETEPDSHLNFSVAVLSVYSRYERSRQCASPNHYHLVWYANLNIPRRSPSQKSLYHPQIDKIATAPDRLLDRVQYSQYPPTCREICPSIRQL